MIHEHEKNGAFACREQTELHGENAPCCACIKHECKKRDLNGEAHTIEEGAENGCPSCEMTIKYYKKEVRREKTMTNYQIDYTIHRLKLLAARKSHAKHETNRELEALYVALEGTPKWKLWKFLSLAIKTAKVEELHRKCCNIQMR